MQAVGALFSAATEALQPTVGTVGLLGSAAFG
jgi:hypothetical protein